MSDHYESLLLASNFKLVVRWAASVMVFADEWQRHQSLVHPTHPPAFWAEAVRDALSGGKRHRALDALATIYRSSQQLPAPGDLLMMGALELKVAQRHFITHQPGSVPQVEVQYYLSIENYRYSERELPQLSSN